MTNQGSYGLIDRARGTIVEVGLNTVLMTAFSAILVAVIVVGWIAPFVYGYLSDLHLFEVLSVSILAQLLWEASTRQRESGVRVMSEEQAMGVLRRRIAKGGIRQARVLSAGLSSRITLIPEMVNAGIQVQVLVQDSTRAIDKDDTVRLRKNLEEIVSGLRRKFQSSLKVVSYLGVATCRCIILYDMDGRAVLTFVGWYTYHEHGTKLLGYINPTIVAETLSRSGRRLLDFAEEEFDRNASEAGTSVLHDGTKTRFRRG